MWSNFALAYHPIRFVIIFFFFFFPATILSGPYLWNSYSQRLQIECAAWSCSLILHCCLPSNSLRYLFIYLFIYLFFFFCHDFVRRRIFHLRGIAPRSQTGRPRTCLVICSVQKTYLRLLTIGLALARASAQLQDSNIPPTGWGEILSPPPCCKLSAPFSSQLTA